MNTELKKLKACPLCGSYNLCENIESAIKSYNARTTWIPVSTPPETEVPVIAYVESAFSNPKATRRVRAYYVPAKTSENYADDFCEYDEETDNYYLPEGWYECNEFEETHWKIDGNVTHWMPLPTPPVEGDK